MSSASDVLIVRGAPGAGKSTLGRELRKALDTGVVIEVDDVRAMIARVDWTSRTHHDTALDVAVTALERFVANGMRPATLIDTFSRGRLTTVQRRLDELRLAHLTVSMWLEPAVLAARLEARSTGFKDWEPSRILNEEVRTNRYPHEFLVDATSLDRHAVVEVVLRLLSSRTEDAV